MNEAKYKAARKAIVYRNESDTYAIISRHYPDWLYHVVEGAGGYCQHTLKVLGLTLDELSETPIEEIDAHELAESLLGVYYSEHWKWLNDCENSTDFCDEALVEGNYLDFMSLVQAGCFLSTLRAVEGLISELSE